MPISARAWLQGQALLAACTIRDSSEAALKPATAGALLDWQHHRQIILYHSVLHADILYTTILPASTRKRHCDRLEELARISMKLCQVRAADGRDGLHSILIAAPRAAGRPAVVLLYWSLEGFRMSCVCTAGNA
jgi:hypothetical protein